MLSKLHCNENEHSEYIAGWKTVADWRDISQQLTVGANTDLWKLVAEEYYMARLELRYLSPIRLLQEHGTFLGEGFSIVAIQCTLLEFLESTVQGKTYRYLRHGEVLGAYEYSSSRDIFVKFLTLRPPFSNEFDNDLAHDFYTGVRCGLLHEARTKNGWRIWAEDTESRIVDKDDKTVFRNNFQAALLRFIENYKLELINNPQYQEAFIRKFDSLCN